LQVSRCSSDKIRPYHFSADQSGSNLWRADMEVCQEKHAAAL